MLKINFKNFPRQYGAVAWNETVNCVHFLHVQNKVAVLIAEHPGAEHWLYCCGAVLFSKCHSKYHKNDLTQNENYSRLS